MKMIRSIILICIAASVYGQSEFDGKCPTNTADIDPFNWDDFTAGDWHEINRNDKSNEIKCPHIEFEKVGNNYTMIYEGELGTEVVEKRELITLVGKSSYTFANRLQTVVVFKTGAYAVIHECVNVGETKRQTLTWMLSKGDGFSESEKTEINAALTSKGLDKEIKIADLTNSHPEECH